MRLRTFILLCLWATGALWAQEKLSKADKYFYGYAYNEAIGEYQKQMADGKLMTNHQFLNLADSYFHVGEYKKASNIYLDINKKDTIMSNHQFNKMLQSLSKTSEIDRVKAYLKTKSTSFSNELAENAAFNFELLQSELGNGSGIRLFNVNDNSAQSDFSPTFFKERLLFSSGRADKSKKMYEPAGEAYLDIYVARIAPDGNIINSNRYDRIPQSRFHKSTPYYSAALNKIFYILSNTEDDQLSFDENGKNALAIGVSDLNGEFRFLLRDLSTSFYYPFYQEATGKLFFAANFDDSYGGTDIYYVHTNNGQIMSAPINLGPRINSPGNEIAPYIFGNSLYFSSDVFYGLGGMDVYKSNIQAKDQYSIPVNLGGEINSVDDDFGFIIRDQGTDGFMGYFSSNRKGSKGNDDIYGFKMSTLPGLKTLILRGKVAKSSGNGIENASIRLLDAENKLIKEVVTNEDGAYQLEIPWRDAIVVEATKEKHSSFSKRYETAELENLQKAPLDIEMESLEDIVTKKEDKPVLKLKDFFFVTKKSDITPEIAVELDKVVSAVQKFPKMKLGIESHTDSRGTKTTNQRLSQQRAEAIRDYLLKKGVSSSNIARAIGYGEERIVNNCTDGVYCLEFLHQQNMRTLIVVSNYEELVQ